MDYDSWRALIVEGIDVFIGLKFFFAVKWYRQWLFGV